MTSLIDMALRSVDVVVVLTVLACYLGNAAHSYDTGGQGNSPMPWLRGERAWGGVGRRENWCEVQCVSESF